MRRPMRTRPSRQAVSCSEGTGKSPNDKKIMRECAKIVVPEEPHGAHRDPDALGRGRVVGVAGSPFMTTQEAAEYIRRSRSWLLKRNDIPYVRGVPNWYRRQDLDDWVERNLFRPEVE